MIEAIIEFGEYRVGFKTEIEKCFEWIKYYFQSYFSFKKYDCENLDIEVQCFRYKKQMIESKEKTQIKGFLNDIWSVVGNNQYFSPTKKCWLEKKEKKIDIYIKNEDVESFLEVARVLRDCFSKHFESIGGIVMHSGCVQVNNKGLLFIGQKNSGKTSMVLTALKWMNANYIANDKTYLFEKKGHLYVLGWPTTCSIALGSLNSTPEVLNYMTKNGLDYPQVVTTDKKLKIEVTPFEMKKIFNTNIVAQSQINYIFFPQIESDRTEIRIEKCNPMQIRRYFEENILTPYDPHYPDWLSLRSVREEEIKLLMEKFISNVAENINAYVLKYGYNMQKTAEKIMEII